MNAAVPGSVANHHYFDRDVGSMAVKLLPSEYYVTTTDTVLTTVLGSCVSACIVDIDNGVAGMNHFMLPEDGEATSRDQTESMRYGAYAMDVLVREMIRSGARRERLQAKVFGGAAVLANMTTLNIGDRNADFVLRYLSAERISVAAQDLRGQHARRVCFIPASGKAVVRKLRGQTDVQLIQREEGELLRKLTTRRATFGPQVGYTAVGEATPAAKTKGSW
ncbi:chemoreceptor glutamine deamidase CheD [Variovorax sp. J2P1-59]|uniref:chemoreceptor glutamine deamidase CheD n=1 Tax=Variovorax flavidus TaxID=3053501 RepID=UPI002578B68B|nr:chemoreceptor glutamine deamidase CheD [Variovorax sp. J2P1-59]MDM0074569.1 chemoreceptor glutamine deamidase CheD [Variovorax sp. J2P1-59]